MSCVITHGWHPWSLFVIWVLGCSFRLLQMDHTVVNDSLMTALLTSWLARKEMLNLASDSRKAMRENLVLLAQLKQPYFAASVVVILISSGLYAWRQYEKNESSPEISNANEHNRDVAHPKPWIFPCRTTHARMFPKRHAFGYSYLQCGYPIVPSTATAAGIVTAKRDDSELGSWWMRIRADDYLERGDGQLGFHSKLLTYLRKECVKDRDWSYAYLVTAPRFFGYAFNPVSFWYIYNQKHQLKWMILEVNNTFDERRTYLLDGSSQANPTRKTDSDPFLPPTEQQRKVPSKAASDFTDTWMKDFHVSPFNSRKGTYSLKALNPFPHVDYNHPTIDNVITLKSSKDHAKLVARLYSTGSAIDPRTLGFIDTFHFVVSWWWVGFLTFPRILKEAFKLFFKRSLHVWFRPEVLRSSIGRVPTSSEISLHEVFHEYLLQLLQGKESAFRITLKTAIPTTPIKLIETTGKYDPDRAVVELEIHVLTPAFYSRLVHYTSLSEAIDRECIFTDEKNRTLWISRPQLLPSILSRRKTTNLEALEFPKSDRKYLDELRWRFMRKLRCPPPHPAYVTNPVGLSRDVRDIRSRLYSELDTFVRRSNNSRLASKYRKIVTKLFLAQKFSLGFPEAIDMIDLMLKALLCYLSAMQFMSWVEINQSSGLYDIHESSTDHTDETAHWGCSHWDWMSFSKTITLVCASHAYGLMKGYR